MNTLLTIPSPSSIPYADKPLKQGGRITNISADELQRKLNIVYRENLTISKDMKITPFKSVIRGQISEENLIQQIHKLTQIGHQHLVLCEMKNVGIGVFASSDIPENTVVAIYNGTIIDEKSVNNPHDEGMLFDDTNFVISTEHYRGIASFFQHLPLNPKQDYDIYKNFIKKNLNRDVSENLKLHYETLSCNFSNSIEDSVKLSNVRQEFINYKNIPIIAFVTDENIKAGDQLGYSYGDDYWLSRNIVSEFFDHKGAIIPRHLYKRTFGIMRIDRFCYKGDYQNLINLFKKPREIMTIPNHQMKCQVQAVDLLASLIKANACTLVINPLIFKISTQD